MKISHLIVTNEDCIGFIYTHKKFGKVVVFRTNKINLEKHIKTINADSMEENETDILSMVLEALPK